MLGRPHDHCLGRREAERGAPGNQTSLRHQKARAAHAAWLGHGRLCRDPGSQGPAAPSNQTRWHPTLGGRPAPPGQDTGTYQLPPLLRDGADVHGVALHHVQEAHFGDSNGADHMDPPGAGGWGQDAGGTPPRALGSSRSSRGAYRTLRGILGQRLLLVPPAYLGARGHTPRRGPATHLRSVVICRAPPRRLQRQHSCGNQTTPR